MRPLRTVISLLLLTAAAVAQPPCSHPPPYDCTELNVNDVAVYIDNNGSVRNFYYPNPGANVSLLPQAQLMIGAVVNGSPRSTWGFYQGPSVSQYSPGPLLNGRPDTARESFATRYRVYRIARNWESMRESAVKEGYRTDYAEWPAALGAPVDTAGRPLFLGDQTAWCVWNDADSLSGAAFAGVPLKAEVRMTMWAYDDDPILRHALFVKYDIVNRSDTLWKDFYAGQYFSGGINNTRTYAGTDSVRELLYLYSGSPLTTAYGVRIPAVGVVALQGPVVPAPGSAAFDFGRTVTGARNLRAAAASTFPQGLPFDERRLYDGLAGLDPYTGGPYINPQTGRPTRFLYGGDPWLNTGWIERNENVNTGFRETMLSHGPVDVPPGGSVSVVGAFIVGRGRDPFHSVTILKHFASYVRSAYMALLSPTAVPQPAVTSSAMNGTVILTWNSGAERDLPNGYRFQGYNVYQGETANGPWHRIFTADKNDNVVILSEETYQPEFSSLSSRGIQTLPNAGLQHHLIVTRDTLLNAPLTDGHAYHFSVRALWENPYNRPMVLESADRPATVVPGGLPPGSDIVSPLTRIPHDRVHDDALIVEVVDPLRLKGNPYRVTLHVSNDTVTWDAVNEASGAAVLTGLRTVNGESSPVIDGFTLRLRRPAVGVRRDQQTPRGWEYLPEGNRWLTGASPTLIMDAFQNGLVYPQVTNYIGRGGTKVKADQLRRVELRFSSSLTQKAYRYVDKVRGFPFNDPPKDTSFVPYILRRGSGYVYQEMVDVPFTVWEVDSLDGDPVPRQLAAGFVETNDSLTSSSGRYLGRGSVNGRWDPTSAAGGGGEILFVFSSPYTDAPQPPYNATAFNLFFHPDSFDVMYLLSSRNDTTLTKGRFRTAQEGDIFRITPNYPLKDGQTYRFSSSPGTVGSAALAKEQRAMERITVFPNPYMGGHALESSPSKRFVRLTGLPAPSRIRIYALSGRLVRTFEHLSASSGFSDWDLRNDEGIKVASGLYLVHIDSPGIGTTVLKLMVLYPDERLNAY